MVAAATFLLRLIFPVFLASASSIRLSVSTTTVETSIVAAMIANAMSRFELLLIVRMIIMSSLVIKLGRNNYDIFT